MRLAKYPDSFFKDYPIEDFPNHPFNVIFVARIEKEKGIYELFEAAKQILSDYPEIGFIYIGGGDEFNSLKKKVQESNLDSNIHLLGWKSNPQIGTYLRKSDALAFPTYAEGFGKTWYEAVLTETPIITTPRPAIAEYLEEGKTTLFVEPKTIKPLKDAILRLYRDRKLRERMKLNLEKLKNEMVKSYDGNFRDCFLSITEE